ncbi:hypothetical protein CLOM_g3344 [Closterium sp. NIES-68]|nr:hypothetical protein CLOM_g3344 [Closterium sp. NIES-68]GJP81635.1 hypothetical protein CLOP_g11790 [Closterium sp. NIES-67]
MEICGNTGALRSARKRARDQDERRQGGASSAAKCGAAHAKIEFAERCDEHSVDSFKDSKMQHHHEPPSGGRPTSGSHDNHGPDMLEDRPEGRRQQRCGAGPAAGCKKVRMVRYPYKPLLPRDGFSWVKYGQKKLTTGDNMIRLYFQCGLRASHACPARRTVDLSCHDPAAPKLLNYFCSHNHEPHYDVSAESAALAPSPNDKHSTVTAAASSSPSKRALLTRKLGPTVPDAPAGKSPGAAGKSPGAAGSPHAGGSASPASPSSQCLPGFAPSAITWGMLEVPSISPLPSPSSNAPSLNAPASPAADYLAALAALLLGLAAPGAAPAHAATSPPHRTPTAVAPSGSDAATAAPSGSSHVPPSPAAVLAALSLLVQSAMADGGGLLGTMSPLPAEGSPLQQQQEPQELPDSRFQLQAAPVTSIFLDLTECPQQLTPGSTAAADSHLVDWTQSVDTGADLLGTTLDWPSNSWVDASEPLSLDAAPTKDDTVSQQQLVICEDECGAIQVVARPVCGPSKGFQCFSKEPVDASETVERGFLASRGSRLSVGSSGRSVDALADIVPSWSPSSEGDGYTSRPLSSIFDNLGTLCEGESW